MEMKFPSDFEHWGKRTQVCALSILCTMSILHVVKQAQTKLQEKN